MFPLTCARAKGQGLGLAFEAEFESLPPTLSIVADASGGLLRCLLELQITLVHSLAQCEYKHKGGQNKVLEKLISELSGGRSRSMFPLAWARARARARIKG